MLVSNIDRLSARPWCLLSASFVVNSRHRTAAFTAGHWYASSIVATRKSPVRSRRALWRFRSRSHNKMKRILFTNERRWCLCEPQNDNRSHHPSDLRRSTVHAGDAGWRVLHACKISGKAAHAACMFEGHGSYTTCAWALFCLF